MKSAEQLKSQLKRRMIASRGVFELKTLEEVEIYCRQIIKVHPNYFPINFTVFFKNLEYLLISKRDYFRTIYHEFLGVQNTIQKDYFEDNNESHSHSTHISRKIRECAKRTEWAIRTDNFVSITTRFPTRTHRGYYSFLKKTIYPDEVMFHSTSSLEDLFIEIANNVLIRYMKENNQNLNFMQFKFVPTTLQSDQIKLIKAEGREKIVDLSQWSFINEINREENQKKISYRHF